MLLAQKLNEGPYCQVGLEVKGGQRLACDGGVQAVSQPLLDGAALIGVAVCSNHGVGQGGLRQGDPREEGGESWNGRPGPGGQS